MNVRAQQSRDYRRALGRYGESLAIEHLRTRGFSVLVRNYRTRLGEIDAIVFDESVLIFVQVKTQMRTSGMRVCESPLEWLSASQLARYRRVAQAWLDDPRHATPTAQRIRFDAIGVLLDARGSLIALEHLEGEA